ncbi:DUF4190 domain-containing protein [Candidatus Nanopelagicales bacterium]|nr:DUF4190 domain-containing protein [Candidatus Nanopelagicales bacterium]
MARTHWSALAIWSLVLSFGLILTAPFAVATGHAAMKELAADPASRGKTPAVIGLILGYLGSTLLLLWALPNLLWFLTGGFVGNGLVTWVIVIFLFGGAAILHRFLTGRLETTGPTLRDTKRWDANTANGRTEHDNE